MRVIKQSSHCERRRHSLDTLNGESSDQRPPRLTMIKLRQSSDAAVSNNQRRFSLSPHCKGSSNVTGVPFIRLNARRETSSTLPRNIRSLYPKRFKAKASKTPAGTLPGRLSSAMINLGNSMLSPTFILKYILYCHSLTRCLSLP